MSLYDNTCSEIKKDYCGADVPKTCGKGCVLKSYFVRDVPNEKIYYIAVVKSDYGCICIVHLEEDIETTDAFAPIILASPHIWVGWDCCGKITYWIAGQKKC